MVFHVWNNKFLSRVRAKYFRRHWLFSKFQSSFSSLSVDKMNYMDTFFEPPPLWMMEELDHSIVAPRRKKFRRQTLDLLSLSDDEFKSSFRMTKG